MSPEKGLTRAVVALQPREGLMALVYIMKRADQSRLLIKLLIFDLLQGS